MTKLPQQYASVYHFKSAHGVTWPASEVWRLTDRLVGEINGVPNSRGVLTATNGILCYVEQEQDGRIVLFLGHVGWFVADKGDSVDTILRRAGAIPPQERRQEKLERLLAAYD